MRALETLWQTQRGRLVCQWFDSQQAGEYDVGLMIVRSWCKAEDKEKPGTDGTLRELVETLEHV